MNIDKTLHDSFINYGKTITEKNAAKTADFIYPKFYDSVPRKTIEDSLKAAYRDNETKIEQNINITERKGDGDERTDAGCDVFCFNQPVCGNFCRVGKRYLNHAGAPAIKVAESSQIWQRETLAVDSGHSIFKTDAAVL